MEISDFVTSVHSKLCNFFSYFRLGVSHWGTEIADSKAEVLWGKFLMEQENESVYEVDFMKGITLKILANFRKKIACIFHS